MKQNYPFYPLEDSLLGQILLEIFSQRDRAKEIQTKFSNYLQEGEPSFYFTSNSIKATQMSVLPPQFRRLYESGDKEAIRAKFVSLLEPPVKMDLVLEILEWVITGLASEEISLLLLGELLRDTSLEHSIYSEINEKYQKMIHSEKS